MQFLPCLVLALVLAACTATTLPEETPLAASTATPEVSLAGTEETPESSASPSPEATAEPAPPLPTAVEISAEDIAVSLVAAEVREIGRYDESVEVEVDQEPPVVSLPGLAFYSATPMVVDSLGERCVVFEEEAWCFKDALQSIISQYSLGANPDQLSDDEWLDLITFFTTAPLTSPDDLGRDKDAMPESEREKINPPVINRPESGGIDISFHFKVVDMMGYGYLALHSMEFSVTPDNVMTLENHEIWNNDELE